MVTLESKPNLENKSNLESEPDLENKPDPAAQAALDLATTGRRLTVNPADPLYAQELIKGMNLILEKLDQMCVRMLLMSAYDAPRRANGRAVHDDDKLVSLPTMPGVIDPAAAALPALGGPPEMFPGTLGALRQLSSESRSGAVCLVVVVLTPLLGDELDVLLAAYALPLDGDTVAKRARFATYIGYFM
ncbi:uncharacterized protein LOC62_01G000184 [Vanrija pseudolonga]|uniref:Uncharacterized protein n=1 Tax=Vanrija pseudolonga TaxID=143232 RepID=A0AAF1BEX9_9TREE|nr:hypothetical protein LOC62_01G000184 [Vanrija pseudolonga]